MSQEQGFLKVNSSASLIWKWSSIVESEISFSPVFFSLLSQVLKTGQEIGFSEYLFSRLCCSSRSKLDLRETRLLVTVGAPSVEESCSQVVVMSSFLFRFRRGNSFSCTSGLNNLFLVPTKCMCCWLMLIKRWLSIGWRTETISRTKVLKEKWKAFLFERESYA